MAVQYGTVASGFNVSSAFSLNRANRTLYIDINSHAGLAWFATFTADGATAYHKPVLDQAALGFPSAIFSGTNGGWGLVPYVPTANMRIETASNVLATTSFTLVEVAARP